MYSVEDLTKTFGAHVALAPITKTFAEGETTVLIGQSGCGKSTLLRLLIGLTEPTSGCANFGGRLVDRNSVSEVRRLVGYMTQDGGLFPHLTAAKNVTLVADMLGRPASDTKSRVEELTKLVDIPPNLLSRFPAELSGGQKQRLSLMRALMLDPKVLLLDEPLGALDPITRHELQDQLKKIFANLKKTVILVTHDMGEAAFFGSEIILMRDGRVVQSGTAEELDKHPAEEYVSLFLNAQRGRVYSGAPDR